MIDMEIGVLERQRRLRVLASVLQDLVVIGEGSYTPNRSEEPDQAVIFKSGHEHFALE